MRVIDNAEKKSKLNRGQEIVNKIVWEMGVPNSRGGVGGMAVNSRNAAQE